MSRSSEYCLVDSVDFSVITVCFNAEEYIEANMRAVNSQSGISYEHVIQDGGSSDNTLFIINKFAGETVNSSSNTIKLVSKPDRGIYDAMNRAIARSNGRYICILNADDYYVSDSVLAAVKNAFESSDADIVYGAARFLSSGKERRVCDPGANLSIGRSLVKQIPHPAIFFRRELMDIIPGPFDIGLKISADFKFQLLAWQAGTVKWKYIPSVLVNIREGGISTAGIGGRLLGWREVAYTYKQVTGRFGWWYVFLKVAFKLKVMIFRK